MFSQIIECIPNFSCGRDAEKLQRIIKPFVIDSEIKVLDYSQDYDHNRAVVTVVGTYDGLLRSVPKVIDNAKNEIDLRKHEGAHPRMGATDVCPFVPIMNADMELCEKLAVAVAGKVGTDSGIPVFLYEKSATRPEHENLAKVRKGQFEGLAEKMKDPVWQPDFGPNHPHESAGAVAIGARMPLIAYNINLASDNLSIADSIAKTIRHIGGGFRYVKAMGVELKEKGIVQVSMNLTDYTKSAIYQVMEAVRSEAKRYGVAVCGSELIGLMPLGALISTASYYLQLDELTPDRIIEARLLDSEE